MMKLSKKVSTFSTKGKI